MNPVNQTLIELLRQALLSEHGIVIEVNDVEVARKRLRQLILQEDNFSELTILTSHENPKKELWLAKKRSQR